MYRGAIIGLGNVALKGHLPAWKNSREFQIVAGVDPDPAQWAAYQKIMPDHSCFATLDECDKLNLDFVDVCTPPHTHFSLVQKALEKKLNVICLEASSRNNAKLGQALISIRKIFPSRVTIASPP